MCGACCVNQGPCVRTRRRHCPAPSPQKKGPPRARTRGRRTARGPLARVRARHRRSIGARLREIRTHHHKNSSTRHQHPAARRLPPKGRGHEQRPRARVVGATRGLSTTPRGGYWRREGVVDIVRGLSTPRGGYNARWCQQRASVRTTRAHANNARRRSSARQRAAPIAPISASSGQRRQRSPPRTGRTSTAARPGPPQPMSHTREGIRKHSAAHKGGIKPLCAARVA